MCDDVLIPLPVVLVHPGEHLVGGQQRGQLLHLVSVQSHGVRGRHSTGRVVIEQLLSILRYEPMEHWS